MQKELTRLRQGWLAAECKFEQMADFMVRNDGFDCSDGCDYKGKEYCERIRNLVKDNHA